MQNIFSPKSRVSTARLVEGIDDAKLKESRAAAVSEYLMQRRKLAQAMTEVTKKDRVAPAYTELVALINGPICEALEKTREEVLENSKNIFRASSCLAGIRRGQGDRVRGLVREWPDGPVKTKIDRFLCDESTSVGDFQALLKGILAGAQQAQRSIANRLKTDFFEPAIKICDRLIKDTISLTEGNLRAQALRRLVKSGLEELHSTDADSANDLAFHEYFSEFILFRETAKKFLVQPIFAEPKSDGPFKKQLQQLCVQFTRGWSDKIDDEVKAVTSNDLTRTALQLLQANFLLSEPRVDIAAELPPALFELPEQELRRSAEELFAAGLLSGTELNELILAFIPASTAPSNETGSKSSPEERTARLKKYLLPLEAMEMDLSGLNEQSFTSLVNVLEGCQLPQNLRDQLLTSRPELVRRPDKLAVRLEFYTELYTRFKSCHDSEPTLVSEITSSTEEAQLEAQESKRSSVYREALDLVQLLRTVGWKEPELVFAIVCEAFSHNSSAASENMYIDRIYTRRHIQHLFHTAVLDAHFDDTIQKLIKCNAIQEHKRGDCLGLNGHVAGVTDETVANLLQFFQKYSNDPDRPLAGKNSIAAEISRLRGDRP